jgi:hypothetical protein
MATTTPNYGWDVPTSTDYVAQGAVAIETLGDDIDASLFSITGGKNVGHVHLNTTTFSGVSAVNVDSVFTSAYQNYKVVLNFTASSIPAGAGIAWRGRTAGSTIATGIYFSQYVRGTGATVNAFTGGDAAIGGISSTYPTYVQMEFGLFSPQLAQVTTSMSPNLYTDGAGGGNVQLIAAWANGTNQFDGINIYPTSGTITGTVRIYGLRNS